MPAPNNLTEKQRKLVVAYLNGASKKDAMLEAGYPPSMSSHRTFEESAVVKEIERRQHIMSTKAGVTGDWIIHRLMLIADAKLSDLIVEDEDGFSQIDMSRMTPALKTALSGFESDKFGDVTKIKIKTSDKLRALEMLARHLGMFNDKLELAGEISLEERLQAGRKRSSGEGGEHGEASDTQTD